MNKKPKKTKGSDNNDIPMPSDVSQTNHLGVDLNREEPHGRFDHEDRGEKYAVDYFDDEEDRLDNLDGPVVANKSEPEWSEGIEDEANPEDSFDDEGLLPETQPLHVDLESEGEDDNPDFILSPDNVEDDSAA